MKTKLLLFVVTLLSCLSQAQNTNDRKIYLDSNGKTTKDTDYDHYLIIENYKLDLNKYPIVEYNKQDVIIMKGTITDKNKRTKNGEFTYYYDNGTIKEICNYTDSKLIGKHEFWYPNGIKKQEGTYLSSNKNEDKLYQIINFWNTENIQTVTNGNGTYEESISFPKQNTENNESIDGNTKGSAKNGKKEGKWTGEYPNIKLSFFENYENGKLIEGIATDSLGLQKKYTEINEKPEYKDGIVNFYKDIGENFNTAPKGEEIKLSGKIHAKFIVKKDGSIDDISIFRGLHPDLDNEAIRVLKKTKKWKPGKLRGQLVNTQFSIPITVNNTFEKKEKEDPFFEKMNSPYRAYK